MSKDWISVAEDYPDERTEVLATDGREYQIAIWTGREWEKEYGRCSVTHWMPIPPLPQPVRPPVVGTDLPSLADEVYRQRNELDSLRRRVEGHNLLPAVQSLEARVRWLEQRSSEEKPEVKALDLAMLAEDYQRQGQHIRELTDGIRLSFKAIEDRLCRLERRFEPILVRDR